VVSGANPDKYTECVFLYIPVLPDSLPYDVVLPYWTIPLATFDREKETLAEREEIFDTTTLLITGFVKSLLSITLTPHL
jgi:hypothetical protein